MSRFPGRFPIVTADRKGRRIDIWEPHRDDETEIGAGFNNYITRLKLDVFTKGDSHTFFARGQDGWAFGAAVRFQDIAHDLASKNEAHYWSGYYLMGVIVERARTDLTFLEAIEALALAYVHGNLSKEDVTKQLTQLGVWP